MTTTRSSERATAPASASSSIEAGARAVGSAAASSSSARCQSDPSEATCRVTRAAALTTRTLRRPRRTCAWSRDPAARTAASNVESGGSPTTADASPSRSTAISSRGASSSSFTIKRPRRAVDGQWTRRRDSPSSWSRTLCSSKPAGRRRRRRRPSLRRVPVSEKRLRSSTSRGKTTSAWASRSRRERPCEPERVLDRELDGLERIAPARHAPQVVAADPASRPALPELDVPRAEPREALVRDERRRRDARRRLDDEVDPDVLALDDVSLRAVAANLRRPGRQPHPGRRRGRRRRRARSPPDRARASRRPRRRRRRPGRVRGPRGPGRSVRSPVGYPSLCRAKCKRDQDAGSVRTWNVRARPRTPARAALQPAEAGGCRRRPHYTGTGVLSSTSATSSGPSRPAERASGPRIRRCESTGAATAFTSSGAR